MLITQIAYLVLYSIFVKGANNSLIGPIQHHDAYYSGLVLVFLQ